MKSFAVDISDQSIKYGELLSTPLGLRLGRFGKEKIPAGVVVSGKIEKEDDLVVILKSLKRRENLDFVRVSLPEEQMYLFTLSLPKTSESDLRDMILLQIEEHIPLKAVDTIFDYDIISSSDKNILIEVSAIASSTVDEYLSVFRKADLSVLSFELEAEAIARAVIPAGDKDPVMIVDFGDTRTGVSIVHDGKVFFTTTLDMGGVNLTNMIEKNFSLSFEKAEEMKRSYGLDGISNIEDIFPVILNGISVLRDELNKQYQYWKNHEDCGIKHDEIKRIVLCGGDANLTGLSEYLEASMKIRVEHANAWVNISDMTLSVPSMSFEESLGYATVLGLALGSFSYSFNPIVNVLPQNEKAFLRNEYWKRFTILLLFILSFILIIATLLLLPSYLYSSSKEIIAENRLEEFNQKNKNITSNNLDSTITKINKKLDLLITFKPGNLLHDEIIGSVLDARPDGVTFTQILYGQKKDKTIYLEIHGQAKDRVTLRNFKSIIDSNPKFASSNLPMSNFLEKTNINFTIYIVVK
jgi:type IV pilus assembly protein PilM